MTTETSAKIEKSEWVWVGGICALALVLRCLKLDFALWYDEILTLARFVRLPLGELLTTYTSLNNHVLYSLEAKASVMLFGEHAWSLRVPAVLFGVAAVAALYGVSRRAVGVWEARLTALLLAVSYHHIWFSQNARGYTGLVFWTLLATSIAIRHFDSTEFRPWIGYACSVALAGYTHLSGALFFAAHGVVFAFAFAYARATNAASGPLIAQPGVRPTLGLALGALLTVLLHAPMLPQMAGTFAEKQVASPEETQLAAHAAAGAAVNAQWTNPLWTVTEVVRSLGDLGPVLAVALPGALAFIVLGGVSLWRRSKLLTSIYAFHIPFTLLLLVLAGMRVWPRYFFLDIGFFFLCLMRGIFVSAHFLADKLKLECRLGPTPPTFAIMAGSGAVLASLVLLPKNYAYPKQDFAGALAYVSRGRAPQDAVAVVGLAALPYAELYKPGWKTVTTPAELEQVRGAPGATWLVYAFASHTRSHFPELMAVVEAEFAQRIKLPGTLGEGEVYVMRSER